MNNNWKKVKAPHGLELRLIFACIDDMIIGGIIIHIRKIQEKLHNDKTRIF